MSIIDTENAKKIRDSMEVHVRVQATISGSVVTYDYTNDDIISCELNLRSDLKPIDPTLPESEIVVRVYCPNDVSDVVKYIADDQPLTYWAGYNGVYSTVRKFYISEPVTWADKVLTFKAVDAVHFLNDTVPPVWDASHSAGNYGRTYLSYTMNSSGVAITSNATANSLTCVFNFYAQQSGVTVSYDHSTGLSMGGSSVPNADALVLMPRGTPREHLANMMNLIRLDFPSGAFNVSALYLTYVDAGIPTMKRNKPTSSWDIYESDCGDIKEDTSRDIVKISPKNKSLLLQTFKSANYKSNSVVGSISITKNSGASVTLNTYVPMALAQTSTGVIAWYTAEALGSVQYTIQNTPSYSGTPYSSTWAHYCYNEGGFVPWGTRLESFWNSAVSAGDIANNATEATFDLYGAAMTADNADNEYTKSGYGTAETPSKTMWYGAAKLKGQDGVTYTFLPDMGFQQLLNRSGKTGSFTWKGDPRMQPRDVFTWHYIDGTTELRTIESINLKHEKGGTVAKITYRKGIV